MTAGSGSPARSIASAVSTSSRRAFAAGVGRRVGDVRVPRGDRGGDDRGGPRGRLLGAREHCGVELEGDRLGERLAHLIPQRVAGVIDNGVGDRHDRGDLLGGQHRVGPIDRRGLLQANVAVDPIGLRQARHHGLLEHLARHAHVAHQRQRRRLHRRELDDLGGPRSRG
jgi:hypothetical protein